MIFAIELKKCIASANIFDIILGKFCYKKSCTQLSCSKLIKN